MEIVLLYNKSNPFGIARDVEGLEEALGPVRKADPLEPPVPCDIAIHLEVPVYAWMPWASTNILVVNPEWFEAAWIPYMPRFQYVVYKDHISAGEALNAGHVSQEQIKVIPWGASEPSPTKEVPKGTVNNGFVWFLGGSRNKRAYVPKLVAAWRPEYPPLRIYCIEPLDVVCPENVRIEVKDLDQATRTALAKFFRGHIACSEAEGFSYAAAESEWQGAFTILNDLNCFICDYDSQEGVKILKTLDDLPAAIKTFEAIDFDAVAAIRKSRAAERYKAFKTCIATAIKPAVTITVTPRTQLPPVIKFDACPPISIVTLMHNRRRFFDLACHNIMTSDYPQDKIEWIIVEDSDDPMEDASDLITATANRSKTVKIVYVPMKKASVAAKRNVGVAKATAEIILMMDDDDHYPVTSFRRRVSWLQHPWRPKAVAATTIACYDLVKGISAVNSPPMNIPLGQRISEASLAFYKSWWVERGFPEAVQVGEGEEFVAGRESDLLEIPPQQIIVAFSHGKNTSSRRIPSGDPNGCFWGFPKEYLVFVHKLAGISVVDQV